MIARFIALLLLIYSLGFVLFAFTLGKPASASSPRTDAGVVLTGGKGRIEYAMADLKQGKVKRLLVSGTDPAVTKGDLARRVPGSGRLLACCVDLGSESVDTRSNAEETSRWIHQHHFRSIRLITSDWHMRRARYEFGKVLGSRVTIVTDALPSEPSFLLLFGEYNKYVLRRLAVWSDLG